MDAIWILQLLSSINLNHEIHSIIIKYIAMYYTVEHLLIYKSFRSF